VAEHAGEMEARFPHKPDEPAMFDEPADSREISGLGMVAMAKRVELARARPSGACTIHCMPWIALQRAIGQVGGLGSSTCTSRESDRASPNLRVGGRTTLWICACAWASR